MRFDILFIDPVAYKPYDNNTMRTDPLGGTESTVIRIAEGLARTGCRVGIVEHCLTAATMGNGVFYLPEAQVHSIRAQHIVSLRGITHLEAFPGAKLYSWQHDLPTPDIVKWKPFLCENKVTVVGVSDWHKSEIQRLLCDRDNPPNPQIAYVHNPVSDSWFVPAGVTLPYDKRKLVWLSSPHKGLSKAISLFARLRELTGDTKLELHVYNPGYFPNAADTAAGVVSRGALAAHQLQREISDALCVFYPSQYAETFGLVAAEANAGQVPVATYRLGALPEVVSTFEQTVGYNDEKALLNLVLSWYSGNRPQVVGQDKFRLSEVIKSWQTLFQRSYS